MLLPFAVPAFSADFQGVSKQIGLHARICEQGFSRRGSSSGAFICPIMDGPCRHAWRATFRTARC
jgi:hypothetical protein